jgi:phosphatidylglycerophosphatase A
MKAFNRRDPVHWLAFGFGSGFFPVSPGTAGTLAAVPIWLLMAGLPLWLYLTLTLLGFAVGCYFCGKTSHDMGVHDHGGIVWDEFVGYWITMIAMPISWQAALTGFILFRIFDILKPWPIRWVDKKVHGGFGIMLDDVLAGLMAWIVMLLLQHYHPSILGL